MFASWFVYHVLMIMALISMQVLEPANALISDEKPPQFEKTHYEYYEDLQDANPSTTKYETEALSKVTHGACYSPFHNPEYPLNGGSLDYQGLVDAINDDFSIMKSYVSVVRTYYTSFYGIPVAEAAAANDIKLYLGVYMTREAWYANQVNDAITAVKNHPDTIAAVIVGNENVQSAGGSYTPAEISQQITEIRNHIKSETGKTVPVGTVQRAADWLDANQRTEMIALAANCDIVGVNIYPFFDPNYRKDYPLVVLNAVWDAMASIFPVSKLRLTEIGFPTAGAAPDYAPNNIPSLSESVAFYEAFVNWNPSSGGGEAFWFMFFDRAPTDNTMQAELEKYFGFFTWDKKMKAADYPARLTAIKLASTTSTSSTTSSPMSTPTPTTTSNPTTPTPTTAVPTQTPTPTTAVPTQSPTSTPNPTTQTPAPSPNPTTATPTQAPTPTTAVPTQTPNPTTAVPTQSPTSTPNPTTQTPAPSPNPTTTMPAQAPTPTTTPNPATPTPTPTPTTVVPTPTSTPITASNPMTSTPTSTTQASTPTPNPTTVQTSNPTTATPTQAPTLTPNPDPTSTSISTPYSSPTPTPCPTTLITTPTPTPCPTTLTTTLTPMTTQALLDTAYPAVATKVCRVKKIW